MKSYTITLTAKDFEYVVNVLVARPYAEVAALLQRIHTQTADKTEPPTEDA